jgi:hypothetical protein
MTTVQLKKKKFNDKFNFNAFAFFSNKYVVSCKVKPTNGASA